MGGKYWIIWGPKISFYPPSEIVISSEYEKKIERENPKKVRVGERKMGNFML